jgi:two-component system sensor histidine kinase BaeS
MKLDITAKLFLILLALSIAISVATGFATRVSFKSQFLGYLNQQGAERADVLVPELARVYARRNNWDYFRENQRRWIEFLRFTARAPNTADLASVHLRMALLDEKQQYVVGYELAGYPQDYRNATAMRAIEIDGQTVGWLVLRSLGNTLTAADLRFQQSQLHTSWIIGISVAMFAALAALWLSRSLLNPIQRITSATQQLADGNYTIRISKASDDTIGRLARDFNRLAEKLQRNEQLRRDFMADIAHELRTPLAVLRSEIEAILDKVREPTPQAMSSLQAEVGTLAKVVEDLYDLSLADIGALTYRMEETDIAAVLQSTLEAFSSRFAALDFKLTTVIESDVRLRADKERIQQLFNNLLENMSRYAQAPGQLKVACASRNGIVALDFHDSGPGVSDEERAHLFERSYRTESAGRHARGGAGLGLAICLKIVEAHGGTIAPHVSELGGLHISIRFPARTSGTA